MGESRCESTLSPSGKVDSLQESPSDNNTASQKALEQLQPRCPPLDPDVAFNPSKDAAKPFPEISKGACRVVRNQSQPQLLGIFLIVRNNKSLIREP